MKFIILTLLFSVFILPTTSYSKSIAKKYHKKSTAKTKRNIASLNKIKDVKSYRLLTFDKAKMKLAEDKMKYIMTQLKDVKTVGQWIDKSKQKQAKLHRRVHFSKHMQEPLPDFTISSFGLSFANKNSKKQSLFIIYPEKSGLVSLLDGVDITAKKGESFKSWQSRISPLFNGRKNAWIDIFISPAYAEMPRFTFAEMMMSMSNSDWEKAELGESDQNLLFENAMDLRTNNGLTCETNGTSYMRVNYGNRNDLPITVRPRLNPNNTAFNVDITRDFQSSNALATLNFDAWGETAFLKQENTGKVWGNETLLPALSQIVYGGDPSTVPTDTPSQGPQPVQLGEIVAATENLRACNSLASAGVTTCNESIGSSGEFQNCVRENILNAKIGGGFLSRSALKNVDPQRALELKLQLLEAYHDFPVTFRMPERFPSASESGPSRQNFTGSNIISTSDVAQAFALGLDENDTFQNEMKNCINGVLAGSLSSCRPSVIGQENYYSLQSLSSSLNFRGPQGESVSNLNETLSGEVGKNPACTSGFTDNNMLIAAHNYEKLEMFTGPDNSARIESNDLFMLGHVSDISRACCSNAQCRDHINGTNRNFNLQRGSGTKSSN